jgi:hypothetical protein
LSRSLSPVIWLYNCAAILVDMKWFFLLSLICFSLMTNDVGCLLVWLLAICISSVEESLLMSLTHLKNWIFLSFYHWVVRILSIL